MHVHRVAGAAIAMAVAIAACGAEQPAGGALPPAAPASTTTSSTTTPTTPAPPSSVPGEVPLAAVGGPLYDAGHDLVAEYVGRDLAVFEADVEAAGLGPVRIAWEDGEYLAVTDDLRVGRVNVAVVTDGDRQVVVDAFVETDDSRATEEASIVAVHEGVPFYPACGDEQLEYAGMRWHQVQRSDYPDVYDRVVQAPREHPPEGITVHGIARVVAPGPGDDVGTLVVWSDGVAYFESDSGDLYAWLVDEELTYYWTC